MKRILALLTKNPILGVLAGALTTAVLVEQQCDNRYGDRFCKCRTDEICRRQSPSSSEPTSERR